MSLAGIFQRLDDAQNPIVVKELRQAVQSRFVVAVLLLFLGLQLLAVGIYLFVIATGGVIESIEYQGGREVFTALQVILLGTCMLFLPLYTGIRLAAERNEVNTDLLFVTTLRPGKIISGKIVSAVVLALLIFSACTPFMLFTYFLRGIDWPSILFIVAIDFLVVIGSVQVMVFLAVLPGNRVLKSLLGLGGLVLLLMIFSMTISGTVTLLMLGITPRLEEKEFWLATGAGLLGMAGAFGLLYSWSVAMISAPSSNRALPVRLYMLGYAVVSGIAMTAASIWARIEIPFAVWLMVMNAQWAFYLVIAINERQHWTPRVTRWIPRAWWLRVPAFLLYSGSAGGVLFAALMMGLTSAAYFVFHEYAVTHGILSAGSWRGDALQRIFNTQGMLFLYTYCYALTAVFVRWFMLRQLAVGVTWVVMLVLVAVGSLGPMLIGLLLFYREWRYETHYYWMLGNPAAAMTEFSDASVFRNQQAFLVFVLSWAALVTLLNLPWVVRQVWAFKPLADDPSAPR